MVKKANDESLYDIVIHLNNKDVTTITWRGSIFAIDKESNLRDPILMIKDLSNRILCIPMSNILYYEFTESEDPKKANDADEDKEGKDA